jgi:hypothetical protein
MSEVISLREKVAQAELAAGIARLERGQAAAIIGDGSSKPASTRDH